MAALDQADRILGEPYYPTLAEHQDLLAVQVELAKPGDSKDAHLGEAETIVIMVSRDLAGFFVADDRDAKRVASSRNIGVTNTWALLKLAFKAKLVDPDTLWGYVQTLNRPSEVTARRLGPCVLRRLATGVAGAQSALGVLCGAPTIRKQACGTIADPGLVRRAVMRIAG